jgi:hypothetical protein
MKLRAPIGTLLERFLPFTLLLLLIGVLSETSTPFDLFNLTLMIIHSVSSNKNQSILDNISMLQMR